MSNELSFTFKSNALCYFQIRNRTSGYIWNGAAFEAYASASGNLNSYAIPASEQGSSAYYSASMPSSIGPGVYDVIAKERLSTFYAESDPNVAGGEVQWDGSIVPPQASAATSGQIGQFLPMRLFRGQMIRNFGVYLVSSADHVTPMTSGVVSGQICRDGGNFGPLQSGAFTEIGFGFYNLQALTSGDLQANTANLLFTANGVSGGQSDPRPLTLILQRTSGQAG